MKKIKPEMNPNGSKTIYVGGIYEVDKTSGGTVTRTVTYYPAGGAMRINSTLYYILKAHLGSASVVTGASGNTVGEQRYCEATPSFQKVTAKSLSPVYRFATYPQSCPGPAILVRITGWGHMH